MSLGGQPAGGCADTAPGPKAPPFHGHLSAPQPSVLDARGTPGYPASARRAAGAEAEALRTVMCLESRAAEQDRRNRELESLVTELRDGSQSAKGRRNGELWDGSESSQALIAELRRREQEGRTRVSELEGTLSQVAVLQKQAMAERLQKEQEYLREISRLERKAAEARSPGQADADAQARLAEAGRREQEHLHQIRKLTEKVEELERAPAIVQTLLAEVAKKDHERLSEIGTLKDALYKARNSMEVCSSTSSPATASMQSLLSGAGRVAELEAEVAGLHRELSASAAVEGELELLKSQLKARDKELQDLEERHSHCRAELEKHQKQGTPRLHGGRKLGCGGTQAGASGNQVFVEWRDHLDKFSAIGNEASFCHMQHLEAELARQLLLDPELLGAIQAFRCEKVERLQAAAPDRPATTPPEPLGGRAVLGFDAIASARGVQPVRAMQRAGHSASGPSLAAGRPAASPAASPAAPVRLAASPAAPVRLAAAAASPLDRAGAARQPLSPRPVSPRPAQWSPRPASPRPLGSVDARGPSTAREGVALRVNTYVAAGLGAHPGVAETARYAADARTASPVRRFASAVAWPAGASTACSPAPGSLAQGGSSSVQAPPLQGQQVSTFAFQSPARGSVYSPTPGRSEARLAHSLSLPMMH